MPLVYADSSVLFAWFHPQDEFSALVDCAVQKHSPDFVYWPFLRFELRHNLRLTRVDSDGEVAWRALRAAEKTASRLRWEPVVEPLPAPCRIGPYRRRGTCQNGECETLSRILGMKSCFNSCQS